MFVYINMTKIVYGQLLVILPFLYWCMAMVYGPPFVTKVIYIHVTKVIWSTAFANPGPQTLSPALIQPVLTCQVVQLSTSWSTAYWMEAYQ